MGWVGFGLLWEVCFRFCNQLSALNVKKHFRKPFPTVFSMLNPQPVGPFLYAPAPPLPLGCSPCSMFHLPLCHFNKLDASRELGPKAERLHLTWFANRREMEGGREWKSRGASANVFYMPKTHIQPSTQHTHTHTQPTIHPTDLFKLPATPRKLAPNMQHCKISLHYYYNL